MLGEVERERLVRARRRPPGDALILTKGIAIEGTAVLAREAADAPAARWACRRPRWSGAAATSSEPGHQRRRARRAAGVRRRRAVHAMHDPTEGGLATALYELADGLRRWACACRTEAIAVLPETRRHLRGRRRSTPLGLLASGALLMAVAEADCERA